MGTFDFLSQVEPQKIADETPFEPFNGAYNCRVESLEHNVGESKKTGEPYDFYTLNCQILETVEGEAKANFYLRQRYNNDEAGITRLRDDLFTADLLGFVDLASNETLDGSAPALKDKPIKIRAWAAAKAVRDSEGKWSTPDRDDKVQRMKVVAEFKLRGMKKSGSDEKATKVPF